jgi:hypothetical protein
VRRPQPLHTSTFLIYENKNLRANGVTYRAGKAAHLFGRVAVAREQDDPARTRGPQQGSFALREIGSRETGNERGKHRAKLGSIGSGDPRKPDTA